MVAPSVLSSFFATTCHVAPVARSAHNCRSSAGVQVCGIDQSTAFANASSVAPFRILLAAGYLDGPLHLVGQHLVVFGEFGE
jgi:hypothetical protein